MLLARRIELEIERIIMPEKNGNDAQWLHSNLRLPKTRRCIGGIKYVIPKSPFIIGIQHQEHSLARPTYRILGYRDVERLG